MLTSNSDTGFFELTFAPNLALVSTVRRFVSDFYERLLGGAEVTRVALATHELLENAVNGASDGQTRLRIDLLQHGSGHRVAVRTWNRASPENQAILANRIAELSDVDPLQYSLQRMRQAAKEPVGSGLGLPRIRAEAEMALKYQLEGDVVCIIAEAEIASVPATA